jgi:hypoxanthine phosphoribosyltransferase
MEMIRLEVAMIPAIIRGGLEQRIMVTAKDLDDAIEGRDVLMIEDIIDTGLTLNYLLRVLRARKPASLAVCTLLDKDVRRLVDLPIEYRGFSIPDRFVVGYGLDLEGVWRNLPYVATLHDEVWDH